MHYSRVSIPPSRAYSAATAVLLNELLKGFISVVIAFIRLDRTTSYSDSMPSLWNPRTMLSRFQTLGKEIFSPDCWKLSIPAILYGAYGLCICIQIHTDFDVMGSHSKQSAICCSNQSGRSDIPSQLPNENPNNCRLLCFTPPQKAEPKPVACALLPRHRSRHCTDTV